MTCPKCNGLMIRQTFLDTREGSSMMSFVGHRCLNCSEVVDPVIERNRSNPQTRKDKGNRKLLRL